jgi:glucose/mannose transport system substrate-binding protein
MKAEVIHWWTSGGESAAVKVLAEQFAKAGGTWVDTAIAGGVNARAAAISRTIGGTPPTAMQFNTGKQFDDLVENDLLRDVDQLATEQKWKSMMPEAIVNATTRNGKMFAVPVDIHGQNWLWMSTAALGKAGAPEPTNWDDVFPVLDKLKAADLIPLAFSGQKVWERNLFNAVLVGKGGNALWAAIYGKRDAAAAKSAEFTAVAETYGKLRSYVDPGAPGRNWNDATNLVIQGKAGLQIMARPRARSSIAPSCLRRAATSWAVMSSCSRGIRPSRRRSSCSPRSCSSRRRRFVSHRRKARSRYALIST